jgi:arylsulfatase A-like enzyme
MADYAGATAPVEDLDDVASFVIGRNVKVALDPPLLPNILILVADDLGVDRLEMYGAPFAAHTPQLDALAERGVVFDTAWAFPTCGPTRAALMTGQLPRRTGWGDASPVSGPDVAELAPGLVTIAELVDFSPWATYSSSYVGKWQLTSPESASGFPDGVTLQGWDWFAGTVIGVDSWFGPLPEPTDLDYFHFGMIDGDTQTYIEVSDTYATTRQTDDAIARITAMSEPWLLQVAYNAPHEPEHIPPLVEPRLYDTTTWSPAASAESDGQLVEGASDHDKHRAAIEAMDTEIGRLLTELEALDGGAVMANTVIFFLADNGSPGWSAHEPEELPGRMKSSLYEGGMHVPLVVAGPMIPQLPVPAAQHTSHLAHVVDLFPTIAELVGVRIRDLPGHLVTPGQLTIDGVSLLPILKDPATATPTRETLYGERFEPGGPPLDGEYEIDLRVIRDATYKLRVNGCTDAQLLFLLPDEDTPVSGVEHDDDATRLRDAMDALLADMAYDGGDSWPDTLNTGCPP